MDEYFYFAHLLVFIFFWNFSPYNFILFISTMFVKHFFRIKLLDLKKSPVISFCNILASPLFMTRTVALVKVLVIIIYHC